MKKLVSFVASAAALASVAAMGSAPAAACDRGCRTVHYRPAVVYYRRAAPCCARYYRPVRVYRAGLCGTYMYWSNKEWACLDARLR
jgi:hypothetical protein